MRDGSAAGPRLARVFFNSIHLMLTRFVVDRGVQGVEWQGCDILGHCCGNANLGKCGHRRDTWTLIILQQILITGKWERTSLEAVSSGSCFLDELVGILLRFPFRSLLDGTMIREFHKAYKNLCWINLKGAKETSTKINTQIKNSKPLLIQGVRGKEFPSNIWSQALLYSLLPPGTTHLCFCLPLKNGTSYGRRVIWLPPKWSPPNIWWRDLFLFGTL